MIEYLGSSVVYENPKPHVCSRHGYFPGMVKLPTGELLTLFVMAEAFEALNATTCITRSQDLGKTWQMQGQLYEKRAFGTSDSLKPTVLSDGSLLAIGYRFYRKDPEEGITIEKTGGFQPGDDIVSFSNDAGKHWTVPTVIEHDFPELIELSGPAIETQSGDLVAVGALYRLPDGSNPSGPVGVLLRSCDKGHTWKRGGQYYKSRNVDPYESRICEMQPGRLVVMIWAYSRACHSHLPNQVIVSHDNGYSWSAPIDTEHMGQSSNLFWLGGDMLLTCHSHRGINPGLYVRIVDFQNDRWRPIEENVIWSPSVAHHIGGNPSTSQMFSSLRFGQPSLLQLNRDEFMLVHWSIEDGHGRIKAHYLRVML